MNNEHFRAARKLSSKLYFEWLLKFDIIQNFSNPETIPSVFYKLGYPSDEHVIFEQIMRFLSTFNIVQEAGGTFVLTRNVEKQKDRFGSIKIDSMQPIVQFINHGMSLVEDRLEGGTGVWDLDQHGYILELGFSQPALQSLAENLGTVINLERISFFVNKPKIALYAAYPGQFIEALDKLFAEKQALVIITPNLNLRDKAITYCELNENTSKFSQHVVSREEMGSSEFDIFFVPNGLPYHYSTVAHLTFIRDHLSKSGYFYYKHETNPSHQVGIEPLYSLHPQSYVLPSPPDFDRLLKSNGFSSSQMAAEVPMFAYSKKA